jgi:hypothetical protein
VFPPPPPPPGPVIVSAFFREHYLAGRVQGFTSHLGATVGGRGAAFMLGVIPSEGMFSIGFEAPRFGGTALSRSADSVVALHGPSFDLQLMSDFSENMAATIGASVLGLSYSSCKVVKGSAFFVQARLPYIDLWLPMVINGETFDETHASPYVGVGAGIEAGFAFY